MLFLCSPSPTLYMMCILILYILIAVVVGCISHTISVLVVVNDVRVYTYGNAYNNGEGIDRRTARQTSTPNVGIVNSGNFKIDLGFFSCSPQWVCRVYSYTRRDERQLSQYAKLVHHFSWLCCMQLCNLKKISECEQKISMVFFFLLYRMFLIAKHYPLV